MYEKRAELRARPLKPKSSSKNVHKKERNVNVANKKNITDGKTIGIKSWEKFYFC